MTVDLACGELGFVDLTFPGLDALPAAGEERYAADFLRSPGGGAITAIGAARLGLSTALVSPIGADADGDFLRAALAAEGVRWAGRKVARTAVTAVLPADGDRAMATFNPGEELTAGELAAVAPRAVVLSLPRLGVAPPAARLYATVGDPDARAAAGAGVAGIERAHALLVNEREARLLTGIDDAEGAARRLAEQAPRVVVTLGPGGALELSGDELVEARAEPFERGRHDRRGRSVHRGLRVGGPPGRRPVRAAALGGPLRLAVRARRHGGGGRGQAGDARGGGRAARADLPGRHASAPIEEEAR